MLLQYFMPAKRKPILDLGPRRPSLEVSRYKTNLQVGLNEVFRKTKRKTEGPQHFAFPEISRENRGCLVLHSVSLEFPSGNSRVSLSLRAGLGQNLGQNLGNRQTTRYF